MNVSLYISSFGVQAVQGKNRGKIPEVSGIMDIPMKKGVFDNGTISDEKEFVRTLRNFWQEKQLPVKDVSLIINNYKVTTGMVEIPPAREKLTYELVKREMSSYEEEQPSIYIYHLIQRAQKEALRQVQGQERKKKRNLFQSKISKEEKAFLESIDRTEEEEKPEQIKGSLDKFLAARIDRDKLDQLLKLIRFAGIEITSVYNALLNFVALLGELPEIASRDCILQIHDEQNIVSMLFLDGVYHYSSLSKIYEEPGSIGFAIEMARSVSGILQFMKANNLSYDALRVLLMGLDPEDVLNCTDSILQMNSTLDVEEIDTDSILHNQSGVDLNTHLFACMGLVPMKKTADFYPVYLRQKQGGEEDILRKGLVPVAALAVVLLAVTVILGVMNVLADSRLGDAMAYNNQMNEDSILYDMTLDEAEHYESQYNAIHEMQENLATYPAADSSVEDIIKTTAADYVDVEVVSYDASTGLYNVSTTASDVKKIHRYINQLRKQELCVSVDYTGYNYSDSTEKWQVNVYCYLAEDAGKDGK